MGEDIDKCRMQIKHGLALYVGGMGAREKNFYNDYTKRLGYEKEAKLIQDLYLSGKKNRSRSCSSRQLCGRDLIGWSRRSHQRTIE